VVALKVRGRRPAAVIATACAIVGIAAGAGLVAWPASVGPSPGLRTIALTIHYSHFSTTHLTVAEGTLATFVVRNTDPIDHELIVGDQAVQDQVEQGTELHHHTAGQISVPAESVATTTYFFAKPGTLLFACHLPGHYIYGMHGTIRVTKVAGGNALGGNGGRRPYWCDIPAATRPRPLAAFA
jgi:uncharacterized cupredoxin-like copper-binding protein